MDLVVPLDGRGDRTVRVYRALRAAVLDGRLPPGHRLPASRVLAADLGVARNSVATAYEQLVAEGYLTARVGAGTFVATGDRAPVTRTTPADPLRPRDDWTFTPLPASADEPVPRYDLRPGVPDATLFPFDTWRRLVSAELRLRTNSPGAYAGPAGHPGLRAAVARYVGYSRGVPAAADDVIVTNGTQHALDLVARVLLRPGDVVAVEEPGYLPARRLFASFGARVVGVPVDAEGLVVGELPERARLVYVTPSHQFPLGVTLSHARREALLDHAARRAVAVVEDDYDSEFRFSARPLEPLYTRDTAGRVLYLGTFSKTMLPSVRTGFLLAPPSLRPALTAARQLGDGFGQVAVQAALARFIDDGHLARHVRRAAKVYAARHARIGSVLGGHELLDVVASAAGLHVTALLRDGDHVSAARVVRAAARHGIALEQLGAGQESGAGQDPDRQSTGPAGFVLGFGAVDLASLDVALDLFGTLLRRAAAA